MLDSGPMAIRLGAACLLGWATTTNYTNHAAVIPVLMVELGFGPVQAGLLSTVFFVTLAIACVPAGMLCDRLGPTRVGTAGLAAVFASNLALGYARHLPDLLAIKVVGGVGCGLAFIAGMRYATLVVPPARVHQALGLYGGFVQLGGGTALYLIPLLTSLMGWRRAFILSSALIALSTAAWLRLAPSVRPTAGAAPLTEATRSPKVWTLGLVHSVTFGLAVLVGIWVTTFLVHDFGLSLVEAGAAGSMILVVGVLSRPFGGWLIDRGALGARAVMKMTGTSRVAAAALSRRQVSKPSSPGIMTSSSTRSGRVCVVWASASSPSSGNTATPTLAVRLRAPSLSGKGLRSARSTFSAMRVASSEWCSPGSTSAKASCSSRAAVSPWRTHARRRSETPCSR